MAKVTFDAAIVQTFEIEVPDEMVDRCKNPHKHREGYPNTVSNEDIAEEAESALCDYCTDWLQKNFPHKGWIDTLPVSVPLEGYIYW